jgi:hypothetical protein
LPTRRSRPGGFGEYFKEKLRVDCFLHVRLARFFYADERHGDGKFKGMALDGGAHGEFYAQLANQEESVPWHATFVKDKGYVQFK